MDAHAAGTAHADTEHLSTARTYEAIHVDAPTLDVDASDSWHPGFEMIAAFAATITGKFAIKITLRIALLDLGITFAYCGVQVDDAK
jgi:hypothetical protein